MRITIQKTCLTVLTLFMAESVGAQTNLYPEFCQYADWSSIYGACTAVDLDNNGYCDLVIAGFGRNVTNAAATSDNDKKRMTHVLLVDPTADMLRWHAVSDSKLPLNVTDRPSLSPCDINLDGNMDIVAFETTGRRATDQPYTSGFAHEGIFLGNGDGTFAQMQPVILDEDGNETNFDMAKILSGTVADINNDGLPDIIGIGYQVQSGVTAKDYEVCNYIFVNRGNGVFQQQPIFSDGDIYHFEMGWVRCYDLNNDGLQDIVISAQMNDNTALGRRVVCMESDHCVETHFLDIFLNNPDAPGTFTRQYLQDTARWGGSAVWAVGECGMSIGDVNNDGVSDLYIVGYCGNGRKHDIWGLFIASLQHDGTVRYDVDYSCPIELARPLNTINQQCGFIDWTGDGNLDYYSPGWYPSYSTQTACIYTNSGDGKFRKTYRMGSGSELASCFVDWDADGVNDLVEMGQSWDGKFFVSGGSHFQATLNPNSAGTLPEAPTLLAPTVADGQVTIAWQRPESAKPNVTYEYWVATADGSLVTSCLSHIGGTFDGRRKVVAPGNACQANRVTLRLPKGDYIYGVQTVDAAYRGSTFATGTFSIETSSISPTSGDYAGTGANANDHIYSITGENLGTDARHLPQGIYIKGNKKTIIR